MKGPTTLAIRKMSTAELEASIPVWDRHQNTARTQAEQLDWERCILVATGELNERAELEEERRKRHIAADLRDTLPEVGRRRTEALAEADRLTAELTGLVRQARYVGLSPTEIADLSGLSRETIYQWTRPTALSGGRAAT